MFQATSFQVAKCSHSSHPVYASVPKRFAHRSSSYEYLRLWKQAGVTYMRHMDQANTMRNMPKLVDRIVRTEAAMKIRGLVPFVHARPAATKVALTFSAKQKRVSLRPFDAPYTAPLDEVKRSIPQREIKHAKPALLSLSYALTSGLKPLESAASWGFMNHSLYDEATPLADMLEKEVMQSRHLHKEYFIERGRRLIRKYMRLPVGDFLVIGVPRDKLAEWVYDSLPYNVPSGIAMPAIVDRPADFKHTLYKEGTHMATMLMCRETLDPLSGFFIVDTNDKKAVEGYCSGLNVHAPASIDLFKEILDPLHLDPLEPAFEEGVEEEREELDRELDTLTAEFSDKLQIKMQKLTEKDLDWHFSDFRPIPI